MYARNAALIAGRVALALKIVPNFENLFPNSKSLINAIESIDWHHV